MKELTEAAARGATGPLVDRIVALSTRLGVSEGAVRTFLHIVGEENLPSERLGEELLRVADDYRRLKAQAAALNPANPDAQGLVAQAQAEIDAGRFEQARELLHQATNIQVEAAQKARALREQAQFAEDEQMLGAARSTSAEGEVELTVRRYVQAAKLFSQAASYVPDSHADERVEYWFRQARTLERQGDERGDNVSLRDSIRIYYQILPKITRERVPLDWAMTQNNLGNALATLGERESGTARLEEAIAAYRAALEERTRERVPLDWAMTQNNLGLALEKLGERESGTTRLEEAAAAYRAALEESTRERVPLVWAAAQNNLGNALAALGGRESGTARLEEAAAAYRAALEERTRERVPLDWAMTQNNLGLVLAALGEREGSTARLEEAVAAYRAALEEWPRERVPLYWAGTQNNLGNALAALGGRESGTARLEEAVAAWGACLTVADTAWPPEWVRQVRANREGALGEIQRRSRK